MYYALIAVGVSQKISHWLITLGRNRSQMNRKYRTRDATPKFRWVGGCSAFFNRSQCGNLVSDSHQLAHIVIDSLAPTVLHELCAFRSFLSLPL